MESDTTIYLLLLVKFSFVSCRVLKSRKYNYNYTVRKKILNLESLKFIFIDIQDMTQTEIHNHKIIDINFPNCKHSITSYLFFHIESRFRLTSS